MRRGRGVTQQLLTCSSASVAVDVSNLRSLSLTVGGNARSIFVLGGNVFAAGVQRDYSDKDYAFLWVNGAAESLGGLGEARGVFVR